MITKEDKKSILNAIGEIDVKDLEIDHADPSAVKWFRFGSYTGIKIVQNIIEQLSERT